jgi:Ca-activated chloride channel homolog
MKGTLTFILILITAGAFAQAERKYIRQGNRAFEDAKFQDAEIRYRKALEKDSASTAADFNLGNALYKEKQYDAAASRFDALAKKKLDADILARQYYNLGNSLYQSGKYKESVEAYKNSLRRIPGDLDAKHNLQLAMNKLKQQQQQEQQQQNKQQQNKQDKQQNQQGKQQNQQNQNQQQQDKNQENKQQNQQQQGKGDEQQDNQNAKGQISKQDAERILKALENDEKNVLKKVQDQKKQGRKAPVDKNW